MISPTTILVAKLMLVPCPWQHELYTNDLSEIYEDYVINKRKVECNYLEKDYKTYTISTNSDPPNRFLQPGHLWHRREVGLCMDHS